MLLSVMLVASAGAFLIRRKAFDDAVAKGKIPVGKAAVAGKFSASFTDETGYEDVSIRELAETVAAVVEYRGALTFDTSKPDGAPRRMLDSSRLAALGWHARTTLADGLQRMYRWYISNRAVVAA